MKKITSSFYKDLAELRPQEKSILLPLGDEEFEIKIKDYLTLDEKTKLFEDTLKVFQADDIDKEDESLKNLLVLMTIFKALTDIEFPEKAIDQVAQFTSLIDVGFAEKVFKSFREGLVEDSANFLKEAMQVALEQVQKQQTQEVAPEV